MFNPLVTDLSKLSDKELTDKIEDLWRRAAAMRYHPMHQQLQSMIAVYTVEFEKRKSNPKKD
jgi:hypothetical protein